MKSKATIDKLLDGSTKIDELKDKIQKTLNIVLGLFFSIKKKDLDSIAFNKTTLGLEKKKVYEFLFRDKRLSIDIKRTDTGSSSNDWVSISLLSKGHTEFEIYTRPKGWTGIPMGNVLKIYKILNQIVECIFEEFPDVKTACQPLFDADSLVEE